VVVAGGKRPQVIDILSVTDERLAGSRQFGMMKKSVNFVQMSVVLHVVVGWPSVGATSPLERKGTPDS